MNTNKYQQHNIDLLKKKDPDTFGYCYSNCVGFKCVLAGCEISPGLVKPGFNPKTILCYNCKKDLKIIK